MATDSDQERVWFAREVLKLFVQAFTQLKLYPHTHQNCKAAVDAFAKRLRTYTGMHDVLRLSVTQDALQTEGQNIYEEENRNENLAFRLYVDGLREISVSKGATNEEAEKLAHVFYNAVIDPRADSTLLLWESDFKNIDYVAINSLSEQWDQPDYLSQDALKLLKDMNRDVEEIVQDLTSPGGKNRYEFELSDGAAELEKAKSIESQSGDREDGDDIFEVSEEALQELRRDAQAWGPDRLLKALVEAGLDGLAMAPDLVGKEQVQWLLRESLETSLRTKDMELLGGILTRLDGEMQLLDEDDGADNEKIFKAVFEYMGQDQNVARLVELAQGGQALGGPKAYVRILSLLGNAGIKAAVATLQGAKGKELVETLSNFIIENIHKDPRLLLPLVDPDRPADTVRQGLIIASKKIKGKELEEVLNQARKHTDPKVKEQATLLWRTGTDEGRIATFMGALTSENKQDRVRALNNLVQVVHRPAIEVMKKAIDDPKFLTRDKDERDLFIEGVRKLGGKAAIAFLQTQTAKSSMLFNRQVLGEIREAAQKALDGIKKEGK
jgi:hypothetical protein